MLVIGGGAAGLIAAHAAKSQYPDKDVVLIHKEEKESIPLSDQFFSGTHDTSGSAGLTDVGLKKVGVDVKINEVLYINSREKKCVLKDFTEILYEKLVVATDSIPSIPCWLKGRDLHNVYTVPKHHGDLDMLYEKLKNFKNIVIIGAGFTGIEISIALRKRGKEITLIEVWPYILTKTFDEDLTGQAEKVILDNGINILKEYGVKEIIGEKEVKAVKIEYSDVIDIIATDAVLLAMGYELDTELAKKISVTASPVDPVSMSEYR